MSDPHPSLAVSSCYAGDYLNWKDWGGRNFGHIEAQDRAFFRAELARAGIPAGPLHVLEIGFGNGAFLAYARERRWSVIGTEVNEELIEVARAHGFDVLATGDPGEATRATFDLVVAFDVLEHIEKAALPQFFHGVAGALKPGGVFVARFPNGDSPFGLPNQHGDITHVTTIGSGIASYLGRLTGLDEIRVGGETQPIYCGRTRYTVHRAVTWPIKLTFEAFVRLVFYPRMNVAYFSKNLVAVFRKPVLP